MRLTPIIVAFMAIITLSTATSTSDISIEIPTPTFTNGPVANPTSPPGFEGKDQIIVGSCIAGDSPPMNNFLYSSTGSPQCYEVDSYRIMDFSIYAGYMCLFYNAARCDGKSMVTYAKGPVNRKRMPDGITSRWYFCGKL